MDKHYIQFAIRIIATPKPDHSAHRSSGKLTFTHLFAEILGGNTTRSSCNHGMNAILISRPDGSAQGQEVQAAAQGGSDRGTLWDTVGCLAPGRLGPNFPSLLAVQLELAPQRDEALRRSRSRFNAVW